MRRAHPLGKRYREWWARGACHRAALRADPLALPTLQNHCIASAIFSAVISTGKLVLAQGTTGKIEASTTRKP
jgi:hypothetical protein